MRVMTPQHLQRLKAVETQAFIDQTIADMQALNIAPSYPVDKSQTHAFVKAVMEDVHQYGLHTEKECYVYIMAWHILGKEILKLKWLMDILEDKEAFSEEKVEALQKAVDAYLMQEMKEIHNEIC
jgi:hypothetical protein